MNRFSAANLLVFLLLAASQALALPTVSITSPTSGQSFGAGATITLTASAAPTSGSHITQVQFKSGSTNLGSPITSSPYTMSWSPAAGSYSLTAVATDTTGSKTSSAVSITVKTTNTLPTVSIGAPTAGSTFGSGAPVTISATASDTDGGIKQVEFFSGTTSLGVDTTSPYSITWTPGAPGTYSLTATATDISNGAKTSTAVSITVLNPPTVNITSPANNATFTPGSSIPINATATVSGTTIKQVDFLVNGVVKSTDTTSPYSTSAWTNVPAGTYTLTAKATDNKNGFNTSAAITVRVAVPHNPPTVTISSTAAGTVSQAPASITATATATADTGSTISYVDFSNGVTTIRSTTGPNYSATWNNLGPHGYLLTAAAVDSTGASTPSSPLYAIVDGADSCNTSPPISAAESKTMLASYGNLPLTFEENAGQSDARVKFLGRGPGYQIFLTRDSSVLALRSSEGRQAAVRMRFAGGNEAAAVSGLEKQPNTTNYLVGSDPAAWRSNVANYAKVRYSAIYPGIDAIYHSGQGKLEYDLIVAPRADPSRIRLAFEGVEDLALDDSGALVLRTAVGSISQWKPAAYQDLGGTRKEIAARYRMLGGNHVAIDLGAYDRTRELVIDPVLVYSTYLSGGDGSSGASAIALSRCGEAFVSGWTWATNFPTSTGAFDGSGDPASRMGFVSKLNQAGTALLYSTYVTGIQFSTANGDIAQSTDLVSIAVDSTGHAYVAGSTNSSDFPVTPNAMFTTPPSDPTAVLAKLSTDGSSLIYATYMDLPSIVGVAVDGSGNAYVAGPRTARKISPDGASILYSFTVGGVGGVGGNDAATAIAVDASGNAYVTGVTHSNNPGTLPVTTGAFETTWPATSSSWTSGFVHKINPAGTALVYGTYFGSQGTVQPTSITVDSSGRVYVGGLSDGAAFPMAIGGARMFNLDLDRAGNRYAFASRLSADGSHLDFFTWVGGQFCDPNNLCSAATTRANGIAVDSSLNVWIAGTTGSNRFPLTKPLYASFSASGGDNMVIKLDPTGNSMLFGTLLNGTTNGSQPPNGQFDSNTTGIQVDSIGSAYVSGWTTKVNFPTTTGAYQIVPRSNYAPNAFVTKINETKDTTTALAVSPNPGAVGGSETLTATVTGNSPTGSVTFYDSSTSIGSAQLSGTTAQLATSSLAGGLHNLSAVYAGDTHNNPSTSTVVQLNVASPNTPPTLSLTGVTDGATLVTNSGSVYHGLTVTATANAAPGNSLTQLTIWFGNTYVQWTLSGASATRNWTLPDLSPGIYTLYAIVIDNNNRTVSSSPIRFVVNSTGATPPTVTMTAPTDGATLQAPGPFALAVNVTQGGAAISNVKYYAGATVIGTGNSSPFSAQWNNPAAGSYSLIALATDTAGAMKLSPPISVTVTSPPPPTVSLTSPSNGASYFTTDVIPLAANAAGNGGATIAKVEFYADGSLLGAAGTPPYNYSWTTAAAGTHSITAMAYDSRNLTATSAAVSITVSVPPSPAIGITSPANGASFTSPASIPITVNAQGGAGASVTRVDYYSGTSLIGTAATAPWSFTWTNVGPGTYSLTARVTDSNNGTATSAAVSVTVTQGALAINADPGFDGSSVSDGAVTVTGTIQAPPNSSVTINGATGTVLADGRFYVNGVPLLTGPNNLTLSVTDPDGNTTSRSISVNGGGPGLFKVNVTPTDGIAPLNVAFSVQNPSNSAFTSIEFDINGDGAADYTASTLANANPTFTLSAGYTVARVTVKNGGTAIYTFTQPIYVYAAVDRYNLVKGVVSNMIDRLKAGNGDSASNLFTESRRDSYRAFFAGMGSSLGSVASQLGTIRGGSFAGDFAEIMIARDDGSGPIAYPIHLVRDSDGVWRIEGM